jgi:hypothetical protein
MYSDALPEFEDCIYCGEALAVDSLGYCGHCHWLVRAECEQGFHQLRKFLRNYALFSQWCAENGLAVSPP